MEPDCQKKLSLQSNIDLVSHKITEIGHTNIRHGEDGVSFFDIPWEDILMRFILPSLPIKTLFNFRAVCREAKELITLYFANNKYLNFCQVPQSMTVEAFEIITKDARKLETILIRNAGQWMAHPLVIPALKSNTHLKKIDFSNCTEHVRNSTLQVIAMNCKDLRVLYLMNCLNIDCTGIQVVAENCSMLERLDISGCQNIASRGIVMVALHCSRLKFLSLAKIYNLSDNAMSKIAKHLPVLEHLNVQGCWRITDDSVRDLLEYSKNLKALQVRQCRDINEQSLQCVRKRGIKIDVRPMFRQNEFQNREGSSLRYRLYLQT